MKINIEKCLKFFDERHLKYQSHTNAIISMIGEEIASKSLLSYMLSRKRRLEVVDGKFQAVKSRNGVGPRLDKWFIERNRKTLYQCEIKNWCAFSTVGVDVLKEGVGKAANGYWDKLLIELRKFDGQKKYGKTSKVLVEMKKLEKYQNFKLEPILILWWPISRNNELKPFFSVNVNKLSIRFKTKFKKLHIFSVSLYFRKLLNERKNLNLDMPNSQYRIKILKSLGIL
ncbi:MAG: hypothetical protein AAB536_02720 [Patescibacteria group bacterium]